MATTKPASVHLDHLIPKESLRFVESQGAAASQALSRPAKGDRLTVLRYQDLDDQDDPYSLFPLFRKPDFQRETSAWTPEMCVELLESVVNNLVVPSLIVWKSPENNFIYILDGAHRVSVVRAWVLDDWGDKAPEGYYERHEFQTEIAEAAERIRRLVKAKIGSFEDIKTAGRKYLAVSRRGGSPKQDLTETEFRRGLFYTDVREGIGFHVQQVPGDYDTAETSFLRINQSGQRLETWEITLIRNRNSSLARSVMSLANGGAGRYWPDIATDAVTQGLRAELQEKSKRIHDLLFVPPLHTPIKDANVPFVASTRYFPKHAYLMEMLPIIGEYKDAETQFSVDRNASAETIIRNGHKLINRAELVLKHLSGASDDPLSLSIVPLFYFYSKAGRYVRSSLYSFVSWLMTGTEDDIRIRKIIFSAQRGRLEHILFEHNVLGAITDKAGSGLRAVPTNIDFYQRLLALLDEDAGPIDSDGFKRRFDGIMKSLTVQRVGERAKEQRQYDETQKTTINLREIFRSAIRCEICGGILDLRMGVQYDHVLGYAETRLTEADTGRPTHPFCNNMRKQIEDHRAGRKKLRLPGLESGLFAVSTEGGQLSLFSLMGEVTFPDE